MPRNEITNAVRKLRKRLGDTQQQFAYRMGLAISTVVRYELTRPPRGKVLGQLAKVAETNGCSEQAEVFRHALEKELDLSALGSVSDLGLTPENPREEEIVQAVLWASRSSNGRLLQNLEASLLQKYRRNRKQVQDAIREAVRLFIEVGSRAQDEPLEAIAEEFSVTPEDVRLWSAVYRSIGPELSLLRKILYSISLGSSSAWLAPHFHISIETAAALEKVWSKVWSKLLPSRKRTQPTDEVPKKGKERNKK